MFRNQLPILTEKELAEREVTQLNADNVFMLANRLYYAMNNGNHIVVRQSLQQLKATIADIESRLSKENTAYVLRE